VIANNTTKPVRPARKARNRRHDIIREFFATALVLAAIKSGGAPAFRIKV
jgi:hypothetical protein